MVNRTLVEENQPGSLHLYVYPLIACVLRNVDFFVMKHANLDIGWKRQNIDISKFCGVSQRMLYFPKRFTFLLLALG